MDINFQKYTGTVIIKHVYLLLAFFIFIQRQKLFGFNNRYVFCHIKNCTMKSICLIKIKFFIIMYYKFANLLTMGY